MKITTLKAGSLVTAIALVSVLTACGNKEAKTDTTSKTSTAVVADEKIVYVNSDTILAKYEYSKEINQKLEKKGKDAQADLVAKQQAAQRDYQQYQAQANSMPADQRAAAEQRLQRKGQELQAYQQNAGAAFQNEQAKEQEALYNKLVDYCKAYAKTKGYKMILTYSKSNPTILFADETLDITNVVLTGLNEAYAKEKK